MNEFCWHRILLIYSIIVIHKIFLIEKLLCSEWKGHNIMKYSNTTLLTRDLRKVSVSTLYTIFDRTNRGDRLKIKGVPNNFISSWKLQMSVSKNKTTNCYKCLYNFTNLIPHLFPNWSKLYMRYCHEYLSVVVLQTSKVFEQMSYFHYTYAIISIFQENT